MQIQLDELRGIPGYRIVAIGGNGIDLIVQTDWEYPSVARTFGWDMRESQVMNAHYYGQVCEHSSTDGTVKCAECGLTPSTFIADAASYLDEHIGDTAEDPGYFD